MAPSTKTPSRLSKPQTLETRNPSLTTTDEVLLIKRAKQGDHEAFRYLVERHMKQAYDVAFGFMNDHHHAEEVTQEGFVRAYRSLQKFRGDAGFGTWLYRIIVNLSLNKLRQSKRRLEREFSASMDGLPSVATTTPVDQGLLSDHIERALHKLSTLQRAVVVLRHIEGLSTKQVSGILQCSEGTVKTHLFRGLKKLRKSLAFLEDEVE